MTPENAQKVFDEVKTQTRRIVKFPHMNPLGQWEATAVGGPDGGTDKHGNTSPESIAIWHTRTGDHVFCPHGIVGDRLWIREACWIWGGWFKICGKWHFTHGHEKRVTFSEPTEALKKGKRGPGWVWRPGIFMPRWACRSVVELTEIRVERVQDISEADIRAEGVKAVWPELDEPMSAGGRFVDESTLLRDGWKSLWCSINGVDSWQRNDWVWVLVFKKLPC